MATDIFECFLCIFALCGLSGAARWVLNGGPTKIRHCIGEIICGLVAGSMAYGFLYNYGIRNGLLFMGTLVGAYLGGDLLHKVREAVSAKMHIPASRRQWDEIDKKKSHSLPVADDLKFACRAKTHPAQKRKPRGNKP